MRIIMLAALLAGGAVPAFAQDADATAPGLFTGLRVEGLAGYENGDGTDGLAYGVGAGFDFDLGGAVVGVEAEYADSTTDASFPGAFPTNVRVEGDTGRDLYVGGRIGGKVAPSTLLYAKAGYTNQKLTGRLTDLTTNQTVRVSDELDGVRAGAGVEQLIGRNAFAKLEYRYSNYEAGAEKHQGLFGLGIRF